MEKRFRVTIERPGDEPVVIENVKGLVALLREEDGIRKAIMGNLQVMDMALMYKAWATGEGRENEKHRTARALSLLLPDFRDSEMVDVTPPRDGMNDPFSELMSGGTQ